MNTGNRRHFSRVLFQTSARIWLEEVPIPAHVIDISLRGALVRLGAPAHPLPGTPCVLELALGEGEAAIRMTAEVAHGETNNLGLICREIDLDSMTHLRRLVELNLGDETLLDRELGALCGSQDEPVPGLK